MSRNNNRKTDWIPLVILCVLIVMLVPIVGYIVYLNVKPVPHHVPVVMEKSAAPCETPHATNVYETPSDIPGVSLIPAANASAEPKWQFDTNSERFWQDGMLSTESEYRSPSVSILYRRVYDTQTFRRRLTYFIAEIFVRDVTLIRTASCRGDFGKTGHGDVEKMAKANHALVAISGDYYGFHNDSLVIRNGEVYRTKLRKGDICLLLRDGTMEMIRGSDADVKKILEKDPWQAWQFGPILLTESGEARTAFPESTLNKENPRCGIGYVEPGHYCFVVVDGRQKYSRGVTLSEFAKLMKSLGCVKAFNLDGGASAHFFWNDQIVSNPSGGGREISDIIYIEKEAYPASPYFPGKDRLSE